MAHRSIATSYWVLLWDYNSNGYRGVVAKEDQSKVAISPRNLIHDEIILAPFQHKRHCTNLQFGADVSSGQRQLSSATFLGNTTMATIQ